MANRHLTTRRALRGIGILAVATLLATGCSGDDDATDDTGGGLGAPSADEDSSGDAERGISDDTIKLGAILDFTGPFAAASPLFQNGIDSWAEKVNGDGGIAGREIEIVYEDGRADPGAAQTAATKLINDDGVFAIITALGSAASASVAELSENEGVIMFPAGPADALYDPVLSHIFVVPVPYQAQAARGVEAMVDLTDGSKVGAVYSTDEFGESGLVGVEAAVDELGLELVADVTFERGAQDLRAQAQSLLDADPDFGVCVCAYGQSALLMRELARLGSPDLPVVASSPTVGAPLFELIGDDGESLYATDFVSHEGTPGWDEAAEAMQASVGHDPDSLELLGSFTNLAVLTTAMAEAEELTTEGVISALESFEDVQIPGLAVPVTFTAERHVASFASGVYQADPANDTWELVADVEEPATPGLAGE